MDTKKYTLYPNNALVWLIAINTVLAGVFMVVTYERSDWIITEFMIAFVGSLLAFLIESKCISLSRDMMCVKYLWFIERRIPWERVKDISLGYDRRLDSYFILIALDDIKLFTKAPRLVWKYLLGHPIKAFKFRISDKQIKDDYLKKLQSFYPRVRLLEKDEDGIKIWPFQ